MGSDAARHAAARPTPNRAVVAEWMMAALKQRHGDRRAHNCQIVDATHPLSGVSRPRSTRAVRMAGLTSAATVAMFSGSAAASAQIVLRFSRAPRHHTGCGALAATLPSTNRSAARHLA